MEKVKSILEYIQKKLGIEKKNPTEEEIGNYSMNEGKPDKVFGFRREIIRLIGIFFGAVLILAFIFASSEGESEKKEVETMPKLTESEIAEVQKPKNTLPNDYETLMAMNKAKELEMQKQAAENAKNNPKSEPVKVEEIPPIPQANYEVPAATQIPIMPEENLEDLTPKIEEKSNSKTERYKAAISFALREKQNSNEDESSESKINKSAQKKLEYYEPNDSTLDAGTIIPVRLLTGINTDVEGQVLAQILADVYDTATGTKLLIPRGSKLIGSYEKKSVTNGRVPVTFKLLTLPNGGSWTISENIVAIDGAGYTGVKGKIHHHTGQKISAGTVSSAIAALGSLAAGNVSANNNTYTAGQIAAQGATANLINITSSMLKDSAEVKNTVTIEPGYEFNVYVTNNITF